MFKLFRKGENADNYEKQYVSMIEEIKSYSWDDFEAVKVLIQPAVEVITQPTNKVNIGVSKLGGTPDLPSNMDWPKYQNSAMVFIAQLNLGELKGYHKNKLLPQRGIVYFFAYFNQPKNEFGTEYEFLPSKEGYKIIYFDGEVSELRSRDFPMDLIKDYHFRPEKITYRTFFHMPPSLETSIIENSNLSEDDKNTIEEYTDSFSDGVIDQILGIPAHIQNPVEYDLVEMYYNLQSEDFEAIKSKVQKEGENFINLLTIPMFNVIGDDPCYFGIHREDLIKRDFDKTVFIIQGT